MQEVTKNYLSKVTRYFYFVTEQHCHLEYCCKKSISLSVRPSVRHTSVLCQNVAETLSLLCGW